MTAEGATAPPDPDPDRRLPTDEATAPPDPDRRLSAAVLAAWVLAGAVTTAAVALAASVARPVLEAVDGMPGWVPVAVTAAVPVTGVLAIAVLPVLRYRTWRFAVRPEEVDLLRGAVVRRRTIVPMARVQHVDTEQGVVGRMLDFTTLRVHTAAATHEIPGIPAREAEALRNDIARRARVPDEV
jgi:hypothetical protein